MTKIKVNILKNPNMRKPEKWEYGKIQNTIWRDENIQELDFHTFAKVVGNYGCIWKSSLLQGGAGNENFKEAYVLALDFDKNITIEEFTDRATDLGLTPTFMYKTYGHSEEQDKFRVVWRLNEVIDNAQLKTALQLMLMEIFPESDEACKDLSRLFVGGKELFFYDDMITLNIDNLINALVTTLTMKNPSKGSRYVKEFCKRIGLNIYNKYPFIVHDDKKEVFSTNPSINNINSELRTKDPKNSDIELYNYDGMIFSFDTKAYNITKNKNSKAKQNKVKGDKVKKTKIIFDGLKEKCALFHDFLSGEKLEHNEIAHLSYNLYIYENYPTILENTLKEFNYNNWENKYNTYNSCINEEYAPSNCAKYCKYYNECHNPRNIREKYYSKEGKIEQLYEVNTIPLTQAEEELDKVYNIINNMNENNVLFVRATTGLGKTELLKKIINQNVIVGVTNHKLGKETLERLYPFNKDILYVKSLETKNMPKALKQNINSLYELGLYGDVRELCKEEVNKYSKSNVKPSYYEDMVTYLDTLERIPQSTTMIMTHCRLSFGNNNSKIDTVILDEDFLKSFIQYKRYEYAHIYKDLDDLYEYCEMMKLCVEDTTILSKLTTAINKFKSDIKAHKDSEIWFKNPLKNFIDVDVNKKFLSQYVKENKHKINSNIFKIMNSEYVTLKQEKFLHTVNGESIKLLNKYKLIIMSATIDDEIHPLFIQKYLPHKSILWKDISNVEQQGKILCNCAYAFSRQSLMKSTEKQQKALDNILSSDKYDNIITFKDNAVIDVEPYNKTKILHYGACEGIDAYKGQDLAVLGTPHTNSVLYEAYGVLLNAKSPKSDRWVVKTVEKYGYKFSINTYESEEDSLLTRIQLYMLYSELIQAVGRARILRTTAKVYVFSALPLPNATIMNVNKAKLKFVDEAINENIQQYINNTKAFETPKIDLVEMANNDILKELNFAV